MKALAAALLCVLLLLFAGWLRYSNVEGDPALRIDTEEVKQDTAELAEESKRFAEESKRLLDEGVNKIAPNNHDDADVPARDEI